MRKKWNKDFKFIFFHRTNLVTIEEEEEVKLM